MAIKMALCALLVNPLITLPNGRRIPELLWHADMERKIAWP